MSDQSPSSVPESLPGDAFAGTPAPTAQAPGESEQAEGVLQSVAGEQAIAPQIPPTTSQMAAPMPRMLQALRNRDFRLFWIGNFLSNVGTWMQNVAQGWLVLDLAGPLAPHQVLGRFQTNGAFWLGVVGFAASAPMLVFALIGGVIADRVNRRNLMLCTQTAMMICAFIMAILAYASPTHARMIKIPEIIWLAFANGLASSLNAPSQQALVPRLVPKEDLANAIALNSAQFNLSRLIGPAIGGLIMAWLSVSANFLLNGISFLALIFVLSKIHYPDQRTGPSGASLWQNLAEGFRYVFQSPQMSSLLMLVALASIFVIPFITFIPLFARDILHAGQRGFGFLMASAGIGAFLGSITIAWLGRKYLRGSFVVRSATLLCVAVIGFTFSRKSFLSGALLMLAGYAMILMVATVNTLLQHLSSEAMRGRVMSFYATAFLGFAPVGSLIAGSLAGAITAPYAIAGMSSLALVAAWALYAMSPELRKLS
ncbi:MAG TPA: MFS transporter [Terriglobales bacterium]|nr:MFS transporter [Terriglobales bacterium]